MIRTGKDTDKEALIQMWKRCFSDSLRFIRFYFDKVYAPDETLVYVENGQPVASLQILPHKIKTGDSFLQAGYISGAMTHPDYRKKGIMAKLLTASFDYMQEKSYAYSFLIPQEKHLTDYYGKFGYVNAFPEYFTSCCCPVNLKISKNITIYTDFFSADFPLLYSVYSHFLMKKTNAVLKSESQFSNILWDFFEEESVLFANKEGFAFSSIKGNSIVLTDFFYKNEETKTEFLQTIAAYYSENKTIVYSDSTSPLTGHKGMIKPLGESIDTITDIYMGRMLE